MFYPARFLHNKRDRGHGGTYLGVLEVSAPALNRLGPYRNFYSFGFHLLVYCDYF